MSNYTSHQQPNNVSQNVSGKAARIANIIALTQKIDLAMRQGVQGDMQPTQKQATSLVGLLEVFMEKDAGDGLPPEIANAHELVRRLRGSGFVLPNKPESRRQRLERRRQEKISEGIRTMVRRSAKSKPKPKRMLRLIYNAVETSRSRH